MTKEQLIKRKNEYLDWELGVFFHFGIRTFYEGHIDWDMKPMPAEAYNPTELDCEQWIRTIKAGGAKYAVLVCKHHDGFANWPSAYTDYSVASTPWREGKGDLVREFVDACHKYDMNVGFYYSPAQFGSVKMDHKEYDDYFINQISELLSNYGKIDYLWFDGCGSEDHEYDTDRIVKAIRSLQPELMIFNMWDPDTRWIFNESGIAGLDDGCMADSLGFSVQTDRTDALDELLFLPGECDCKIRANWFYGDADIPTLKSLEELWGIYLSSIGRGCNLLLNIAPDRRGLIGDEDAKRFLELHERVEKEFSTPFMTLKDFRIEEGEAYVNNVRFDNSKLLKYIVLEEDLSEGESHITDFTIELAPVEFGTNKLIHKGFAVGHKMIVPIPYLAANGFTIRITGWRGDHYKLKDIKVYTCDRF